MNKFALAGFASEILKEAMVKEAPFKSQAQRRFMYAAERRGDVPKGTATRWQKETPKSKKLPERVKAAASKEALSQLTRSKKLLTSALSSGSSSVWGMLASKIKNPMYKRTATEIVKNLLKGAK